MNFTLRSPAPTLRPGLSAIELTVVLFMLQVFLGMSFVGVRAYKTGSDRAQCVMNIRNCQNAVRSYANFEARQPGEEIDLVDGGLLDELVGDERFLEALPACPGDGTYLTLGNRIPAFGELYLSCSLAESKDHVPSTLQQW